MSTKVIATERAGSSMGKLRLLTIGMVIGSLLVSCVPLILPETTGSKSEGFSKIAIIGLGLSSLAIVAAILFALGLKDFKDEFKKTYYYLCAGLVIQAVGVLLYPIAIYLGLVDNPFMSSGGTAIYLVGAILIFIGLRHFVGLLQLRTWLNSRLYVGVLTTMVAMALWATTHNLALAGITTFDLLLGSILGFFCALLVWVIRSRASLFYSQPLQWLAIALFLDSFGNGIYAIANLVAVNGTPDPNLTLVSGLTFIVDRIIYLIAGYSLISLTHKEEVRQTDASLVDVIVYMADLVSKKADIDPMLDKLRAITVDMPKDKTLSANQLKSLSVLYGQLQDYLLNREPLLALTRESLDRRLQHKFGTIPLSIDHNHSN